MPCTLHIKAVSGPRPVTVAAVRALLADGRLAADRPLLSVDGGARWLTATAALEVVSGQAVDDAAIDAALARGHRELHPLAMPVGWIALAGLVLALGVGGGPLPGRIAALPGGCAEAAAGTAKGGLEALRAAAAASRELAWRGIRTVGGGGAPAMPAMPEPPAVPGAPADQPAAPAQPQAPAEPVTPPPADAKPGAPIPPSAQW